MPAVLQVPAVAGLALGFGQPAVALRRDPEPAAAADPLGGTPIPAGVLSALRRRQGGGRSLPSGPAAEIGHSLGPAASEARIHTDAEADRLARSVQSVAFSYGSDVYFSRGSYAPDTERGQHLLAHELSHVAQGAAGTSGGGAVIGRADDAAERDADRSAATVLGALRRQAARLPAAPAGGSAATVLGALRRQAARLAAAPAGGSVAPAPAGLRRVPSRAGLRRVYVGDDRARILALAQVGNGQRVDELGAHNWTADDTVRLAGWGETVPSYDELNAIMGFFSWPQVQALGAVCDSWGQLVALARAPGWTAAQISALVADDDNLPTWAQLKLIVTRLTAAQSTALVADAVKVNWNDLTQLAAAAAPADQSPAVTLDRALQACRGFIAEQIAAFRDVLRMDIDPRRYTALMVGTDHIQGTDFERVTDYLRDARFFSVCFDTARRMLTELGNGVTGGHESGGAVDATYPLNQQQERSARLIQHLTAASQGGAAKIFEIRVGAHGFTLTVIGNRVYQLEAFASQANEKPEELAISKDLESSLLTSIEANRTYTLADVTTALGQITSAQADDRETGADTMGWGALGCGFVHGEQITNPMVIWWTSAGLLSNAAIVVRLAQRVQRQAAEILAMFPPRSLRAARRRGVRSAVAGLVG